MGTGLSVLMPAQDILTSLGFPTGNPRKDPTSCMSQGVASVSVCVEDHLGACEGGGSWGRHAGHKQTSAATAGRASERKTVQPTENELVLMFTEHLFRLSNMAQSCSAVGSWSPQHSLDVFWCSVHGTGQVAGWRWGRLVLSC